MKKRPSNYVLKPDDLRPQWVNPHAFARTSNYGVQF